MKFNAATLLPVILSVAAQVHAECEPGKQEEVVPDYNVEYKCNTYRTGTLHRSIDTIEQCAQICKDAGTEHCSYGPSHKQCVVGDESGEDKVRSGIYYMKKLEDDPFPEEDEDPFPPADCEEEKADLDAKLKDCESKRKDCESKRKPERAVCSRDNTKEIDVSTHTYKMYCGRLHSAATVKDTVTGLTLTECIDYCSLRSWCDYALFKASDSTCLAVPRKVPYTQTPGIVNAEWACAVKKR